MKKIITIALGLILILTLFASCGTTENGKEESSSDAENGSLKIVTTIFPIYDWTVNITGDGSGVTYLDKSGIDLHSFEPTANDILALSEADVFIYIGGSSDKWVEGALKSANNPDLITVSLMDVTGVLEEETVEGMEAEEDHGHSEAEPAEYDEHIWLSLKKAQTAVNAIVKAVSEADPGNSEKYSVNGEIYINSLKELDGEYEKMVSSAKRDTLLFADRFPFRYLTEDYSLSYYAAFPGCSSESEASFETMTFLIEKTKELKLPYILVLETSDGKIADTVSNSADASVLTVNSCQSVSDEDIAKGTTYISVMKSNLEIFREALN